MRFRGIVAVLVLALLAGCAGANSSTPVAADDRPMTVRATVELSDVTPKTPLVTTAIIVARNGTYEGDIQDGKRHGRGTFVWDNGDTYSGEWDNGRIHGLGTFQFQEIGQYQGSFIDGKRSGQGTFTWVDGDNYEGAWENDLMVGIGKYTFAIGDAYEGEWAEGKMHGRGTYTFADGLSLSGLWEHNKIATDTLGPAHTPNAGFVRDVTIPDDTIMGPRVAFVKTWELRNTGTCDWDAGYQLKHVDGHALGSTGSVVVPSTKAGADIEISVEMVAPDQPSTFRSAWQMCSGTGECFGTVVYAQIVVAIPTPINRPMVTPSPTPGP